MKLFRKPSIAERLQQEVRDTEHALLTAQTVAEDWTAQVRVYEERLVRLRSRIDALSIGEQLEAMSNDIR